MDQGKYLCALIVGGKEPSIAIFVLNTGHKSQWLWLLTQDHHEKRVKLNYVTEYG